MNHDGKVKYIEIKNILLQRRTDHPLTKKKKATTLSQHRQFFHIHSMNYETKYVKQKIWKSLISQKLNFVIVLIEPQNPIKNFQ